MLAEILINHNISLTHPFFTYNIPDEYYPHSLMSGELVIVPFRKTRVTGIIWKLEQDSKEEKRSYQIKDIQKIIDPGPRLSPFHLSLSEWLSAYYLCPLFKVVKLFIPQSLWQEKVTVQRDEIITIKNDRTAENFITKESTRYKKQIDFIKFLLNKKEISKIGFGDQKINLTNLRSLEKKGMIEIKKGKILSRLEHYLPSHLTEKTTKTLTSEQEEIIKGKDFAPANKPILIHGITGSGKTELYLQLCKRLLNEDTRTRTPLVPRESPISSQRIDAALQLQVSSNHFPPQAFILVPEISLTPQLIEYFFQDFGYRISVWHSRLTPHEKAQEWMRIFTGEAQLVIGSRSALFLPYQNLRLMVIDEEHESSYKQEQTPRYHTHEVAEKIHEMTGATLVFGSATPRIETYYKTQQGVYQLHELKRRIYQHQQRTKEGVLPQITIVDLREEFKKKNYSIFSEVLQKSLSETLNNKKQAILFLNRRGTASAVMCRECGETIFCPRCDIPLSHHSLMHKAKTPILLCHHCNYRGAAPSVCPHCESPYIKFLGIGTEKIEQEVKKLFPHARTMRVDRDTTSKKYSFQETYEAIKTHKVDIVIGTQMITKGFDIEDMNLVGVVVADVGLNIPDFRSSEKVFQLLTQVAGRAGRRAEKGQVIIQTYNPDHASIQYASQHDYLGFYKYEIKNRQQLSYPPISRLIKLTYVDKKAQKALDEAKKLATILTRKNVDHLHTIAVAPALIMKLHDNYRYNIIVKGPNPHALLQGIELKEPWKIDVDPQYSV